MQTKILTCALSFSLCGVPGFLLALSTATPQTSNNLITENTKAETQIENNPFAISFYQQNYILPFYYTSSPDNAVYGNQLPNNQPLSHYDLKFQLSLKYPLWDFNEKQKLYIAYTQMSYWQAYQSSAFFRETDYEPEIFLANEINQPLVQGWQANFLNVGALHQSNGEGGNLERSWNRLYLNLISGKNNWMVGFQPWYIIQDSTLENQNPDIGHYMGYEQITVAYKHANQEVALQARNTLESGFTRSGLTLTWSFPTGLRSLKGYVQAFNGYGQSLIEYNHRTTSIGVGISLSDLL